MAELEVSNETDEHLIYRESFTKRLVGFVLPGLFFLMVGPSLLAVPLGLLFTPGFDAVMAGVGVGGLLLLAAAFWLLKRGLWRRRFVLDRDLLSLPGGETVPYEKIRRIGVGRVRGWRFDLLQERWEQGGRYEKLLLEWEAPSGEVRRRAFTTTFYVSSDEGPDLVENLKQRSGCEPEGIQTTWFLGRIRFEGED